MSPAKPFILGDLLAQEQLGLRLLSGAEDSLERPVLGAHGIEIANPSNWLGRDWVMLTTGVRLRGRLSLQRELVAELDRKGMVALGFGVELVFKKVPDALVEEAQRRSFPVLEVPLPTPFRDIIGFVNRSLLSSDLRRLQRLDSMRSYLLDAGRGREPWKAVLTRLAHLLDSTVLVFTGDGKLEHSTGDAPEEEIGAELSRRDAEAQEFHLAGWHAVSVPVSVEGRPHHWLVSTTMRADGLARFVKPLVETGASLLEVIDRARVIAWAEERAVRADLLEQVLKGGVSFLDVTRARLESCGICLDASARILILSDREQRDSKQSPLGAARHRLEGFLASRHVASLISEQEDRLIVLLQGGDELGALVGEHLAGAQTLIAALGRPFLLRHGAVESLRDAELAFDHLEHDPRFRRLLRFEDFSLIEWVIADMSADRLRPKIGELLDEIKRNRMLYETLVEYLDADLDVGHAAKALHLHPNSLRYRLGRIEELLGSSLHELSTISSLYLATTFDRLSWGPAGGSSSLEV